MTQPPQFSGTDRVERFFSDLLRHGKGEWAGRRFLLEPWQLERVVRPIFGTLRPDGLRQYRTVYLEMGRKNGKSTLIAGLGLFLLFADGEAGAEIYSAAADRDQAAIVFDTAKRMIEASPALAERCEVYRRSIVVPHTGSVYRVLSADAPTKHGLNPHAVLFDELHAQRDRELWDVLTSGQGSRRQPLVIAITTAGYDRKSICYEMRQYAERVRDGVISDPTFLPVIYSAQADSDWSSHDTWKIANPNLGVSIKSDFLEREAAKARELPAAQNTFRRLYLCQWTEQDVRWLDVDTWRACDGQVSLMELAGRPCYAGLDLSTTTDLSAFVLYFPPQSEGEVPKVLPYFWIPEENVTKRVKRDRVPYDAWIQSGYIETTEGNVTDYDVIRKRINEIAQHFEIREIAFDRWNANQISTQLQGDGFNMVQFGQGFASMSAPTKELERLVTSRQLAHGGNPVLTWMASNVSVKTDPAGNLKPAKDKSADRIDGIVALVMAIGRASVSDAPGEVRIWSIA